MERTRTPWFLFLILAIPWLCGAIEEDIYVVRTTASGERYRELVSPIAKSQHDPRHYTGIVLENQLRVVMVSDPDTVTSSVSLHISVGSLDDPKEFSGLTQLLMNSLMLGSDFYNDVLGLESSEKSNHDTGNTQITYDATTYHYEVNHEEFVDSLDKFSQIFISPTLPQEVIDTELKNLDSEFKLEIDTDLWRTKYAQANFSEPKHPFSWISKRSQESLLETLDTKGVNIRDELIKFFNDKFSANLMNLVVVTDLPMDEVTELVVSNFSKINNLDAPIPYHPGPVYRDQDRGVLITVDSMTSKNHLQLQFELPTQITDYRCVPILVIAAYIEFQGAGSLMAALKKKNWATDISVSTINNYNGFAILEVNLKLTNLGMENKDAIFSYFFESLSLFKHRGINQQRVDELTHQGYLEFQFGELKKGSLFASKLVSSMTHSTPLSKVLWPKFIPTAFNSIAISEALKFVSPSNMRVTYMSPISDDDPGLQIEPMSGTRFNIKKIDKQLIGKLERIYRTRDLCSDVGLTLPSPNQFYPTTFKKFGSKNDNNVHPIKIYESRTSTLWHSFGKSQGLIAGINLMLCNDISIGSAFNSSQTSLLKFTIMDMLSDIMYDGKAAGMETLIEAEGCGITIKVTGFEQHMDVYIEKMIRSISSLEVDEINLSKYVELFKAEVDSFQFKTLTEKTEYYANQLYMRNVWNLSSSLESVDKIKPYDLTSFIKDFFGNLSINMMAIGNISPDKAVHTIKIIDEALGTGAVSVQEIPESITLPEGKSWIYNVPIYRHGNEMSGIWYFLELNNIYDYNLEAYTALIGNDISGFEYDPHQSIMQLGHNYAKGATAVGRSSGIVVQFQSDLSPTLATKSIQKMFTSYYRLTRHTTKSEFKEMVASYVKSIGNRQRDFKELREYYWSFIKDGSYKFDHEDRIVKKLKKVTLKKFKNIVYSNFLKESTDRRRLVINLIPGDSISEPTKMHNKKMGKLIKDIDVWKAKRKQV